MVDPTTPKYGLNLPQPGDSMADVANGFNNAWPIIMNAPKPDGVVAGSVLPTTGYQIGQVIYLQGWHSLFVLIGNDAHWGYIWRPIHAKFSPWITLTAGQFLSDTVNYILATEGAPRYRLSNDGKFYLGGGITRASSGTPVAWPNSSAGTSPLNAFPSCVLNDKAVQVLLPMHKSGMSNNNGNYVAKMTVAMPGGTPSIAVWNNAIGTADATSVFFNQVAWQIADRTDL